MKNHTITSHKERINRALLYIQQHLDDHMSLDRLASYACLSPYHFHRIFTAYVGETVAAYIRRLKIERAAGQLIYTDENITDIAFSAGFDSASSFNKAFKQITGLTPSEVRKKGTLTSYQLCCEPDKTITGEAMKPTFVTTAPKTVIFIRRQGNYYESAPAAWKAMSNYIVEKKFDTSKLQLIGISHDDPEITQEEHWRFDACVAGVNLPSPDGEVGVQTIEGGKYAVFTHTGSYDALGDVYRDIFGTWYPESGIELRDAPTFQIYINRSFENEYGKMSDEERQKMITEIYIPIK